MSEVPSNYPQQLGNSLERSAPNKPSRPGWLEIIVGLVVYAIVGFVGVSQFKRLGLDPAAYGLILTSWTGVATLIAFAVAARLRVRSLSALGVRRTSVRWLLIGVGVGLVAFVLKSLAILAWVRITGDTNNVQDVYADGSRGGLLFLVLSNVSSG
jgi:uncharacterized protein